MHYHYIPTPTPTPPPTPPPAVLPTQPPVAAQRGPSFVIGAYQQPLENFEILEMMGVNVLVGLPMGKDPIAWNAARRKTKLWRISEVIGDPAQDATDDTLLAWLFDDEPDGKGIPVSALQAKKASTAALGVPWMLNVDGSRLLGIQKPNPVDFDYQAAVNVADWVSSDIYPVSGWNRNVSWRTPGQATAKLNEMTGGTKPVLQFVETSRQIQWAGPTVADTMLNLRQALYHKVRGVVLFTIDFNMAWDGAFFGVDAEHFEAIAAWAEKQNQ